MARGKMYTFVRLDRSAAVLRVDASNAVLRFVSENAAAAPWAGCATAGARVALEVVRYDNSLKAVVCRRECARESEAARAGERVWEPGGEPTAKRTRV